MAKIAKLTVSYPHEFPEGKRYRVVRAQHTTKYNPGDYLTKAEVDELHASKWWDVASVLGDVQRNRKYPQYDPQ